MNITNKYGCLMALPPIEHCHKIVDFAKKIIPVNILYTDSNDSSYGYTDQDVHCTIKYGFYPDLSKRDLAQVLHQVKPFKVRLKSLNQFNSENYDVVKFEVEKDEILSKLRDICDEFPNEDQYPEYNPHMTMAYVKSGTFPNTKSDLNIELPITRFMYSDSNGKNTYINLKIT